MAEKEKINAQELGKFLVEAKTNTWASGMPAFILPDSRRELVFERGIYKYRDRYFDDDPNPFIGEEIVWREGEPIWGMNYRGWFTKEGKKEQKQKRVTRLLHESLRNLNDIKFPFRGPKTFSSKEIKGLVYSNKYSGEIFNFEGKEMIFSGTSNKLDVKTGKILYELQYHGGVI